MFMELHVLVLTRFRRVLIGPSIMLPFRPVYSPFWDFGFMVSLFHGAFCGPFWVVRWGPIGI